MIRSGDDMGPERCLDEVRFMATLVDAAPMSTPDEYASIRQVVKACDDFLGEMQKHNVHGSHARAIHELRTTVNSLRDRLRKYENTDSHN